MICPNCHNETRKNTGFCVKCGISMGRTAGKAPGYRTSSVMSALLSEPYTAGYGNRKNNSSVMAGLLAMFIVRVMIAIAMGIFGLLVWKVIIPAVHPKTVPVSSSNIVSETDEGMEIETVSDAAAEALETAAEVSETVIDADEIFADIDARVAAAKIQMREDAEITNVMSVLSSAVGDYVEKAEETGIVSQAAARVGDTYGLYVEAVDRHKDVISASALSAAVYVQVMSEIDAAGALGRELAQKGYPADLSGLEALRAAFDESYRKRITDAFDELTARETWPGDEAWNLMKDTADTMFVPSDLDNPIRMRYAYALARWTQERIETELSSGVITKKAAAMKIASLMETMDYNPVMIDCYIRYMNASKEDCASVKAAYNGMIKQIKDTQGIKIGKDIKLSHFWYFNDISSPGSNVMDGSMNGVTQENREWIRERMKDAEFIHS